MVSEHNLFLRDFLAKGNTVFLDFQPVVSERSRTVAEGGGVIPMLSVWELGIKIFSIFAKWKKNISTLSNLRIKIGTVDFKERFRQKAEDFSRENRQKLSFPMVFTSLLHRMVKSLDVGVQELVAYLGKDPRLDCRKQSYSDARQKIKWEVDCQKFGKKYPKK